MNIYKIILLLYTSSFAIGEASIKLESAKDVFNYIKASYFQDLLMLRYVSTQKGIRDSETLIRQYI